MNKSEALQQIFSQQSELIPVDTSPRAAVKIADRIRAYKTEYKKTGTISDAKALSLFEDLGFLVSFKISHPEIL